jgi:hypothetical protein
MAALSGNYHFLTSKPLTRNIFEIQKEWLYILPLVDITAAVLDIVITYTDATTQDADVALGDLTKGEVNVVDIGFPAQDYNSHQAKTIESIAIKIDSDAEKIILKPVDLSTDNIRHLFYMNSLGGIDSLICIGDQQDNLETSRLISQKELSIDAPLDESEFIVSSIKARAPFNVYTGIKPDKEIRAAKDLFLVNEIFEQIENDGTFAMVPIIVDQKSVKFPSKNNNLKAIQFTARPAWDEVALDRIV